MNKRDENPSGNNIPNTNTAIGTEGGIGIGNSHRKLNNNITLNDVCYVEEERKLRNDWTISYKGILYQLKKQSLYYPPTKSTVHVRMYMDETIDTFYRNNPIKYEEIKQKYM
jgi:hypothetical protein